MGIGKGGSSPSPGGVTSEVINRLSYHLYKQARRERRRTCSVERTTIPLPGVPTGEGVESEPDDFKPRRVQLSDLKFSPNPGMVALHKGTVFRPLNA